MTDPTTIGNYMVSIRRLPDNRISLDVTPVSGLLGGDYEQVLPAAYGDGMPSYDIAFQTGTTSRAHPLDEMEYHYGPQMGAEILAGVFTVAQKQYNKLMEVTGYSSPQVLATMEAAHDALTLCQERKKL
jgi:hypothetical protein